MLDMWRRVLPYLARYRGRLAFGFAALVLCRVFYLIVPQVLERAVDALEAGATSEMWTYGGFIVAAAGGSAGLPLLHALVPDRGLAVRGVRPAAGLLSPPGSGSRRRSTPASGSATSCPAARRT